MLMPSLLPPNQASLPSLELQNLRRLWNL